LVALVGQLLLVVATRGIERNILMELRRGVDTELAGNVEDVKVQLGSASPWTMVAECEYPPG
jgi:hypothetical protein